MRHPEKPDPGSAGLKVLLVEDEIMVALLLEDMLADLGHTVIGPVGRLGVAIEMAQQEAIDVALLDINLNGQATYPVAETLAGRGIPFIFCTGYGNGSVREPYRDRPTLQKPFQQRDLEERLARLYRAKHGFPLSRE